VISRPITITTATSTAIGEELGWDEHRTREEIVLFQAEAELEGLVVAP
jgi:hypothetical protein